MNREIVDMLLKAPDSQLDARLKPMIEKWNDPPTALQVLEVLDHCIHGSLASGFVVSLLQHSYDHRCAAEGITHDDCAKLATWRNRA